MKKSLFLIVAGLLCGFMAMAQDKKPASPARTVESANVSIVYNAPSKKGREIFGGLVPYNQIWRTGANGATEVTFKKDVKFGTASVPAGTYSLFTMPGVKEWTVILNSELKQWGAYNYDKIKDKNVAVITVKSESTKEVVEEMSITASDKAIGIAWDKTMVSIPLKW